MGGFLARLRKSIPRAGTRQAVVTTPVPRQSKQTWIPVPMAEAQTNRLPTVRELLARQAAKEIPRGSLLEAPQPTALRSPLAREVSTTETGGQEPIAMDAEAQKEPTVPSSGMATDEPVIPTDLECQVRTMEVTVAQETVTLVTEEEEPMGPPPIETRTIETQRGTMQRSTRGSWINWEGWRWRIKVRPNSCKGPHNQSQLWDQQRSLA